MGSPVSTAVAAGASASANRSPAAFDDMTDATSQIAGNSNSYTTNGQSCGMEMIAAGLNMYGDKPDAARTGGSVRPPHDEEKANLYIINAASKERFSHMTCENGGSIAEALLRMPEIRSTLAGFRCDHVAVFAIVFLSGSRSNLQYTKVL
ncbi:hypothetical protein PG991_011762 [Apiospora marii]|uniref:Uncharacterized protein n=1 Tax=Apiospora marii TaxID=335849 RepID=A0ABR1RH65_9PEZI